ncbi:MAG: stress response translation initiation inhibitor YciH [Candidatus Altiarchaeales archaeon]|nr:MAG: stress response translation initiation inhibitor YciH [Candidatus Altiarchaeales archaeon]RLI95100.1 MAG: stress response translation initiation inhibitor YciH [Candidatus Altiarchaeales archaeon]RLI95482.1 MAG: stress response translation initiation inhibitor YciH [Candidatus Altiarchaeales archaeon]HDO82581.1 translation initiation factor [Candidatus Altiarchaeales archaeon]HEX55230.1 translation initiation factor [Candidatus Altiarchaeales archaeon]
MNCPRCGLPKELCVCEEMTKEAQRIRVTSDRRTYGKVVTIIDGLRDVDIEKIAKELKRRLACGGTAKNNRIELQGDHLNKMKDILIEMGFSEDMIEIS